MVVPVTYRLPVAAVVVMEVLELPQPHTKSAGTVEPAGL
jgi:hypothetical protein